MRLAAGGPVLRNLALLEEWQSLPAAELQQLQDERLADLLLHAHRSTDYYRRILTARGVVSSDGGVHLNRLGALPLLDKSLLRTEFENIKSADLNRRRWYPNASGGSTGETARFIQDRDYDAWVGAVKLQFDGWTGSQICDRKAVLWGSSHDVDGSRNPLRTRLGRWLSNEFWLRTYQLTEADMIAHAHAINAFRPVQLLAYSDNAYELARVVEQTGMSMYPPRSIMTSAGTLYPAMRETIERALGAPVFNRYGSREVGDIACECDQHTGLHVNVLCHHVEILRPDGSPAELGEEGEIVITNLTNYAMPLIRYRIGDIGEWSTQLCACGRTWPLLARVSGRTCDMFVNRDGAQVGAEYFFFEFEKYEWLRRFRLVQEAVDRVEVFLQLFSNSDEVDSSQRDEIRSIVRKAVGEDCVVNIQIVPEIESMPSGKHLCVMSKVGSHQDARK